MIIKRIYSYIHLYRREWKKNLGMVINLILDLAE